VAGEATSIREGIERASQAIDRRDAMRKLEELVEASKAGQSRVEATA
jgi:anthranilate phosphoribosyltransferase